VNKETRKDTQKQFYEAIAVAILTYGSEIWTVKKKKEAKIETSEMKLFWSVAGCTRKGQIRSIKIKEEF
jgi:hypothetical protein